MADRGYQIAQIQAPDFSSSFNMMDRAMENRLLSSGLISSGVGDFTRQGVNNLVSEAAQIIRSSNDPVGAARQISADPRYAGVIDSVGMGKLMSIADTQRVTNYNQWDTNSQYALAKYDAAILAAEKNGDIKALREANLAKQQLIAQQNLKDTGTWGDINNILKDRASIEATQLSNRKQAWDLQNEQDIQKYITDLWQYFNSIGTELDVRDINSALARIKNDSNLTQEQKDYYTKALILSVNDSRYNTLWNNIGAERTANERSVENITSSPDTAFSGDNILAQNEYIKSYNASQQNAGAPIRTLSDMSTRLLQQSNMIKRLYSSTDRRMLQGINLYTRSPFDITSTNWESIQDIDKQISSAIGPAEEGKSYAKFITSNSVQLANMIKRKTGVVPEQGLINFLLTNMVVTDPDVIKDGDLLSTHSAELDTAVELGSQIVKGTRNGNGLALVLNLSELDKVYKTIQDSYNNFKTYGATLASNQEDYARALQDKDDALRFTAAVKNRNDVNMLNQNIPVALTAIDKSAQLLENIYRTGLVDTRTSEQLEEEVDEEDAMNQRKAKAMQADIILNTLTNIPSAGLAQGLFEQGRSPNLDRELKEQKEYKEHKLENRMKLDDIQSKIEYLKRGIDTGTKQLKDIENKADIRDVKVAKYSEGVNKFSQKTKLNNRDNIAETGLNKYGFYNKSKALLTPQEIKESKKIKQRILDDSEMLRQLEAAAAEAERMVYKYIPNRNNTQR